MTHNQQKRLLIVDDELNTRRVLRMYLEKEGYLIEEAEDGLDALQMIEQTEYDLIILDLMLPHLDGLELCLQIRRKGMTPVIILSARAEQSDRLRGFEAGADDYVVKPFSPKEVVYRTKTILQRTYALTDQAPSEEEQENPVEFPNLTIDPRAHRVTVCGKVIELARKEFDLLYFFATHPNTTFSRDDLLERVWSDISIQDQRTVDTHIRKIRMKIGAQCPTAVDLITTIWGVGYQLSVVKA